MGYLPLEDLGATIFFQLVSARYERGSIILTSNKSYGEWGTVSPASSNSAPPRGAVQDEAPKLTPEIENADI
jgi:hypothetical protein